MKNLLLTCALMLSATCLMAVPARRTVSTFTQPDGTTIQVMPYGDEFAHFFTDALTGELLTRDAATGFWRPMKEQEVNEANALWDASRLEAAKARKASSPKRMGGTQTSGDVSLPVLLVEFKDRKFTEQYGSFAHYDSILNSDTYIEHIYTTSAGKKFYARSARNYFRSQSADKFRPTFDIIGPITLDSVYSYYGKNNSAGSDMNWRKMVSEGINKAINQKLITTASQWDGDGNGVVDLIYVIYAGWAESQHQEDENAIWPKNGTFGSVKVPDGTIFAQTSMSSELMWSPKFKYDDTNIKDDGIGTLVHEFGHALGLPDFYDTGYKYTCYGMDAWSIMDQGCYSGENHIPQSMTVHERMMLGWMEPEDFPTNDTVITLAPISTSYQGYILRNPANPNEYLTFENHQHDGNWDEAWASANYTIVPADTGMLITHVDYAASSWSSNTVNNTAAHQRCTPLCADGISFGYPNAQTQEEFNLWRQNFRSDIFPGLAKVTTLNNENPLTIWFTGDSIQINLTNIEQLENGDLRITVSNPSSTAIESVKTITTDNAATKQKRIRLIDGRFVIQGFDLLGRKLDIKL